MSLDARGIALVVVAVSTLQVGAAFAVTLFDEVGSSGAALLSASQRRRTSVSRRTLRPVGRASLADWSAMARM